MLSNLFSQYKKFSKMSYIVSVGNILSQSTQKIQIDHRGKAFPLWPLSMVLAVDFYKCPLSDEEVPMFHSLLSVFIMKQCWNLAIAFSASMEMIWFLFFILSILCIIWFSHVEPALHLWSKSYLLMVYNPYLWCWIMFTSNLLKIFAPIFIRHIDRSYLPDCFLGKLT